MVANIVVKPKIWTMVSFWILGICNDFGYVVMLSSAHDILKLKPSEAESNKVRYIYGKLYQKNRINLH